MGIQKVITVPPMHEVINPFFFQLLHDADDRDWKIVFQVGPLPPVAHVNGADPKAPDPFGELGRWAVTESH